MQTNLKKRNQDKVQILLATCNGEKYLKEQLDSLLYQTYQNIEILIHDDGSFDRTEYIIADMAMQYSDKLKVISDDISYGSAQGNFMSLLKEADAPYIMFCDQDDVWMPNKVEDLLWEMKRIEQKAQEKIPTLLFSDYVVTDADLIPVSQKKTSSQKVKPQYDLSHLLVQNVVTGCTVMANRALYEKADCAGQHIEMHDWWMALCAASFGQIFYRNKPLMYYRQHGANVVGAVDVTSFHYIMARLQDKRYKKSMQVYVRQAELLLEQKQCYMSEDKRRIVEEFIHIPQERKIKRIAMMIKGKYLKSTLVRIIGQLLYV